MKIKNKHIIVTGGSSGIGKVTAQQLVQKGARVLITGRDPQKLEEVASQIGAIPLEFDISDLGSIPIKAEEAIKKLQGQVDALINNAGIGIFGTLEEIKEKNIIDVYTTNVFGLALLTQEVLPVFKNQQYGNIINVASTASLRGFAGGSLYASSKFALRGMTQSWQAELRKYNIRVCLINPSEVTTAFGSQSRVERQEVPNKLGSSDIADAIISTLSMRDKAFIPELTIWATNPF